MRIAELRARERYDDILAQTLRHQLSVWFGEDFAVTSHGSGQRWDEHQVFSAYLSRHASRAVRRFLADQIRYTRVRSRMIPQFAAGTAAATRLGTRLASQPGFAVSPSIPRGCDRTILPGNRRLRFFDLSERKSRVVLKHGFGPDAIATELCVRGDGRTGPFPPILAYDADAGWFEEPMIDGHVLARLPPYRSLAASRDLTLRTVAAWAAPQREHIPVDRWWATNRTALDHLGPLEASVRAALEPMSTIEVQPSHGDLQPGNVLVGPRGGRVWLLDWEFFGVRSRPYDALVLLTGLRWPERAAASIIDVVRGRVLIPSLRTASRVERRRAVLVALVEDIALRLRGWDGELSAAMPPSVPVLVALVQRVLETEGA